MSKDMFILIYASAICNIIQAVSYPGMIRPTSSHSQLYTVPERTLS